MKRKPSPRRVRGQRFLWTRSRSQFSNSGKQTSSLASSLSRSLGGETCHFSRSHSIKASRFDFSSRFSSRNIVPSPVRSQAGFMFVFLHNETRVSADGLLFPFSISESALCEIPIIFASLTSFHPFATLKALIRCPTANVDIETLFLTFVGILAILLPSCLGKVLISRNPLLCLHFLVIISLDISSKEYPYEKT